MLGGDQLRAFRERRGWTQQQAAERLGVTQAYFSMLELGRRSAPPRLVNALANLFDFPVTALPLPSVVEEMSDSKLARVLATLGYPGFRHLTVPSGGLRNPAAVLVAALCKPCLEARTVEALPWLALAYFDLDWNWVVREAKLRDLQNRLGYVVLLARKLAEKSNRPEAMQRLGEVEKRLEPSRLARQDSFAGESLSQAERRWLRRSRPSEARHWNLLTDLTVEQIQHAS